MLMPPLPSRRQQPDRSFDGVGGALAAAEDPVEDTRVLAVAGPHELPVLVLAEPVDVEDPRQLRALALADRQPVTEVVGHVVAAERQHRHRVPAQPADLAGGRGGRLGGHRRAEEHAVLPVARLVHERHDARAATAEQHRVDRHARGVLPLRRDRRALRGRCGEAGVRVRGGRLGIGRPVAPPPVDRVGWRLCRQPLPPDVAVIGLGAVGEDRIAADRVDRVRVGDRSGTRRRRRRTLPRG